LASYLTREQRSYNPFCLKCNALYESYLAHRMSRTTAKFRYNAPHYTSYSDMQGIQSCMSKSFHYL
jgi:hypothetical protein